MKKLLTMFMSLLVIVTLTACSGGSSVTGTYELSEATIDGETYNLDELKDLMSTSVDNAYIKLESDGACTVDIFGSSGEGTYEVNGSTVSITIEGDTQDFQLENGKLSADVYGTEMVFEKQ